jgi:polyisoprenoid-binding protein YceI
MRGVGWIAALACVVATPSVEARIVRGSGKPTIAFSAKGPSGMSIVGTSSEIIIRDDGKTLSIAVPLKALTTGLALRDKHMREKYLEVERYAVAELVVPRAALKPPGVAPVSADTQGVLKIRDRSRSVPLHYTLKKNGPTILVTGSMRLDIRDYGITVPSFLGVTVKPEIDIAVSFDAKDV